MIAVAFGMGLRLALTRRRPEPRRLAPRIAGGAVKPSAA